MFPEATSRRKRRERAGVDAVVSNYNFFGWHALIKKLLLLHFRSGDYSGGAVAMGPREIEMAACRLFFLRDPRPECDEVFPMLPAFDGPEDAGSHRPPLPHEPVPG